ncbi:MAG: PKD domain-containing protein [Xanthomonadales bacterium]|nr:PKD domain-containing protein [Xanthomonadales bacterium]
MKRILTTVLLAAATAVAAAQPSPPASGGESYLPRFASHERSNISCDQTPFGRTATIGQETEFVHLFAGGGTFNGFDEYQPTAPGAPNPLSRSFRASLTQGALAGTAFLDAVTIDLNGDGRDEVVTAHRVTANGHLRLGVFRRSGNNVELFDTWTLTRTFNVVQLAAADLSGAANGRQQLAVLLRGTNPAGLELHVLTGDGAGGIFQTDGNSAGRWQRAGVFGHVSLAAGDLLLEGREQLVVVNESGSGQSRALNYHLLSYLPQVAQMPVAAGDVNIGTFSHASPLGTSWDVDDGGGIGLTSIERLIARAGDLVDSAAHELALLVQFRSGSSLNYIGMRLVRWTTTRDADNAITGVAFNSRGPGADFDSSVMLQSAESDPLRSFDAVIGSIDRISPAELVIARGRTSGSGVGVEAYKVQAQTTASYTWERNGLTVQFTDQSTGPIVSRTWNFGDNSGTVSAINPTKVFAQAGNYNVRLTVVDSDGSQRQYQRTIAVSASGTSSGGDLASYRYLFRSSPSYEASHSLGQGQYATAIRVAVGDMDKDGIAEVMTVAQGPTQRMTRSVWKLASTANPASFAGRHQSEELDGYSGLAAHVVLAADLDGDSLLATLATDCRQVEEPQVRQVIWMPPYFQRLQATANKLASFGESTTGGTSSERRSGSFTSHDVSAYLGISIGSEAAGVEASVRATAGYFWQASNGALSGSENSYRLDQSFSQDQGDALVVIEENTFNCYSYNVATQNGGQDPDSAVRMCEVVDGSRLMSGTDARFWDTQIPATPVDHPPAQWMPLHRDWASLSLFRPVTSNVQFAGGQVASNATDGLFTTQAASTGQAFRPYLEIDLGRTMDISNIRVFPSAGNAANLKGYRVYASPTPMPASGLPSGGNVRVFAPETGDDVAYSQWSIWTRNRNNPSQMLSARYIRLQHPGLARMNVAQIQVFGDTRLDPPAYPEAVCDPLANDGYFNALVWDPGQGVSGGFRTIQVRGDLLWDGSGGYPVNGGCNHHGNLRTHPIWANTAIGNSATTAWNLSQDASNLVGDITGFESAIRVGAEFDLQAGFIAKVQLGGAYEWSSGITEEVQTTSFWGSGLEIGGAIGGFAPAYSDLIQSCRYNPRPYAYRLIDVSNTGYEHTAYVVDYVVRQGPGTWQRGNVPVLCSRADAIFGNGFQ